MNDPGLDDAIEQNAKKVEREIHEDEEVEANDEQTFLKPRYAPLGVVLAQMYALGLHSYIDCTRQPLVVCLDCLSSARGKKLAPLNFLQRPLQRHTHPWYRELLDLWPARSRYVP